MAAAAIAVLTGAYLWDALHEGATGTPEYLLGFGALCGLAAWAVQLTIGRPPTSGSAGPPAPANPVALPLAALLLGLAVIGMAAARYA